LAVAVGLLMAAGMARMAWANVSTLRVEPFPAPGAVELEGLAKRAGWSGPVRWVGDRKTFDELLPVWGDRNRRERIELYAVPGQVSRFVWYQADQDRTQFWSFFAAGPRPESLDRSRLWLEAGGRLKAAEWGNRNGIVLMAPANAHFADTGDAAQLNLVTVRAFVVWDAEGRRFRMEEPVVFPLQISLVDGKRVAAAVVTGTAKAVGPQKVTPRGEILRALSLEPSEPLGGQERESAMAFGDLEIPRGSKFEAGVSVHPRWYGQHQAPPVKLELWVDGERIAERVLTGKTEPAEQKYLRWEADLGKYGGRRVELKLRAVGRAEKPERDEVLVGEPRVVQGLLEPRP